MRSTIYDTEQYFNEGVAAAKRGTPQWENPYDYGLELLAANAWDDGHKSALAAGEESADGCP